MSSRRKRLSRSPSDCGSNFFVYMSRYKQKKPVLFFQKPVYRFAAGCNRGRINLSLARSIQYRTAWVHNHLSGLSHPHRVFMLLGVGANHLMQNVNSLLESFMSIDFHTNGAPTIKLASPIASFQSLSPLQPGLNNRRLNCNRTPPPQMTGTTYWH